MPEEIRWHYRFASFSRAYSLLHEALESDLETLNPLEREGLIRRFKYTFELGWKLLKDRLEYDGVTVAATPRAVIRAAYKTRFIEDGDAWMDMLTDRTRTSHKYDSDLIQDVVGNISSRYFTVFTHLHETHSLARADAPGKAAMSEPGLSTVAVRSNVGIVIYRRNSAEAI